MDSAENKQSSQRNAIDRYIRTVIRLRMRATGRRNWQDRLADAITDFSGKMSFVFIHVIWFGGWIIANLGLFGIEPFDPFPFGFLTMIVSLEAIFLATFVLISQNRLTEYAERRSDLDLHVDLLTEYELTRVLQMLHAIQDKLGISEDVDEELLDLEAQIDPEDILDRIERLQDRAARLMKTEPPTGE